MTGLRRINGLRYYFDSNGAQKTGWRKIGGNYYFFSNRAKQLGYMRRKRVVNGIQLANSGKAILNDRAKRKLDLYVRCTSILDQICKGTDSKGTKLQKAFAYVVNNCRATNMGGFQSWGDWDMYYAETAIYTGRGDCYGMAAYFAYMASAVGFGQVKLESSGGHGWVELKGLFFDPNWALVIGTSMCYKVPPYLSGWSGRPDWANNIYYVKNLDNL